MDFKPDWQTRRIGVQLVMTRRSLFAGAFLGMRKAHVGVNLKAAKALGLDVPLHVLARADEVIE